MIIFYNKNTGQIIGSSMQRTHTEQQLKMWIGNKDETDRIVCEWKRTGKEVTNEITQDKLVKVGVAENGEDIFKKVTEVRRNKVREFEPELQPEIYTGLDNRELNIRDFKVDLETKELVQLNETEQMERALARQTRAKDKKPNRLNSAKEVITKIEELEERILKLEEQLNKR